MWGITLESISQMLKSLGLKDKETKVYIHLAKKGTKKAREIYYGCEYYNKIKKGD